jgi:NAD(P)-dependent dehydrogenase (short-subunit alcohol dehydrogenase family)
MLLILAPKNIRVNCVNPGLIHTNYIFKGVITKEQLQEDIKKYPHKRYEKHEEIAYAVSNFFLMPVHVNNRVKY